MVPGWHYWHTRSGCQRRPRPSSFVANSWRLQQCQPRPQSDCLQRWDRYHCLPNLRLSEVKLSLIVAKGCLPETRPWWPTKVSPSLGRLAGLYTETSTRSSWNQCWVRVSWQFLPSCSRAMSWIVWLNSLWGMTLLTLIVLLVIYMFLENWKQVATYLAPSCSPCCGPQAWWRRC